MFKSSEKLRPDLRTVGVVFRDDSKICPGYALFSAGQMTFLVDLDGKVVHEWIAARNVFSAKLRANGNLVRDGRENPDVVDWPVVAGGYIEEVTWENVRLWRYQALPSYRYLNHHSLELMPNGNVLVSLWERLSKDQALSLGRRPDFLPDNELWKDRVVELEPDYENGGASVVWEWDMCDHLIQDYDMNCANYGIVHEHPEKFDINACPTGGKNGQRDALGVVGLKPGKTGERDWMHMNSIAYDPIHDHIVLSLCVHSEVIIIDHSTTTDEARGPKGDFLFRWGNPFNYRLGKRSDQRLFNQHSALIIQNSVGKGNLLVFNNGRTPDRAYSSVDEIVLPRKGNNFEKESGRPYGPIEASWTFGPRTFHNRSFYASHLSSVRRLSNENTFVCDGPKGILFEIDRFGTEVWRYISPVVFDYDTPGFSVIHQGDTPLPTARRCIFAAEKYPLSFPAFVDRDLAPRFYLEV